MKCNYCDKEINNIGSLKAHEKYCSKNPNKEIKIRSPLAGAKKKSIPWNKGIKIGRNKKWDDKYPIESILTEDSKYPRHSLKKRILENNILEYKCKVCNVGPLWNTKPMPLILDHINGINNDNRLENLRFVCSNCDSQLDTYKSKNKIRKPPVD